MNNKTSFTIELTEAELENFRGMWLCSETQIKLKQSGDIVFIGVVNKISEAIAPKEPEKPVSLEDYFQF